MADARDLKNEKLLKLLGEYKENGSIEKLTELAEEMRISQVHMPCKKNDVGGMAAMIIKTNDGKMLIPIFTDQKRLEGKLPNNTQIAVVPYLEVNRIAASEIEHKHLDGIIFNMSNENIVFNNNFIMNIHFTEEESKKQGKNIPYDFTHSGPPIFNKELEKKMEAFTLEQDKQKKQAVFNDMLNDLRTSRIILPLGVNDKGGTAPLINNNKDNGDKLMITYTDPAFAAQRHPECKYAPYTFDKAVELALKIKAEVNGMCIISEKVTINLKTPLLEQIAEVNEKMALHPMGAQPQAARPQQAVNTVVAEQIKFTMDTLPKLLEKRGQKLVDGLVELGEEYIDELYENAYFNIEKYPFKKEDFTVTAITASETKDAIEIDFPQRGAGVGTALRAYIIWDNEANQGRYFAVCKNAEGPASIIEISGDKKVQKGTSEVETNEMSQIFDIAEIW